MILEKIIAGGCHTRATETAARSPCRVSETDVLEQTPNGRYPLLMTTTHYPRYRVLTGRDDDTFCHRVSEALDLGYELHGGPAITSTGENVHVAQALVWTKREPTPERRNNDD